VQPGPLLQVLMRLLFPGPQVTEQLCQDPKSDHSEINHRQMLKKTKTNGMSRTFCFVFSRSVVFSDKVVNSVCVAHSGVNFVQ